MVIFDVWDLILSCLDHCFGWNVDGVQKIQSFSGDAQISEAEISRGMTYMYT